MATFLGKATKNRHFFEFEIEQEILEKTKILEEHLEERIFDFV